MSIQPTPDDSLFFTPAPSLRHRADGWTPERQYAFIAALAMIGSVGAAARSVGMSARSTYRLRARAGAESFVAAWDHAVERGADVALDAAIQRAIEGVEAPVLHRRKVVATRRVYNDRLVIATLKATTAHRTGFAGPAGQRRAAANP